MKKKERYDDVPHQIVASRVSVRRRRVSNATSKDGDAEVGGAEHDDVTLEGIRPNANANMFCPLLRLWLWSSATWPKVRRWIMARRRRTLGRP